MEIEKTAVWLSIKKVLNSGYKTGTLSAYSFFDLVVHTKDHDFKVVKVLNIDVSSDYVNNYTDVISVTFMVFISDYKSKLFPEINNLEASLVKTYLSGVGGNDTPTISSQRFKLVFLPNSNVKLNTSLVDSADKLTSTNLGFMEVSCQLINRNIEPIKLKTFSGIMKGHLTEDILKSVIPDQLSKISVDGKICIDRVDVVKVDNVQPSKHAIIPTGTSIINIPTYLHEKMNGIYNSGIGTYITNFKNKNVFFIYPTHKLDIVNNDNISLSLYVVPENKLGVNDVSYNLDGKSLSILGHTLDSFGSDSDAKLLNSGVGFNMLHSKPIMNKPVDITTDGPMGAPEKLNYRVATTDRSDNFNYAPKVTGVSSNNPFREYSNINKRAGNVVRFLWSYANDSLLYPGAPVIFYSVREGKTKKYTGILQGYHSAYMFEGKTIKDTRYHCKCVLTCYVG